ncbi:MAG: hypothetical protein ACT4P6_22720 [Gemmatimonadaceae bacterium]
MTSPRGSLYSMIPVALLLSVGCYNYVPISAAAPPLGSEFRAQLTEEGSARLTPLLGAQVALVEGRVSGTNDSAYVVSISATTNRAQQQTFWTGESITLPRSTVQAIEARKLDRRKTWLIAAAGVIGGLVTAQIFGWGGSASGTDGGGGPPPP